MSSSPSTRLYNQGSMESNGTAKRQKLSSDFDQDQPLKSISDTTYFRLLCPASKIGRITGEDGNFLSQVFWRTGMGVRVEDPVQGCDERVVVIKGSRKVTDIGAQRQEDGRQEAENAKPSGDGKEHEGNVGDKKLVNVPDSKSDLDVSCVQKALFLVTERIAELKGETDVVDREKEKQFLCVVRLIVLTSQVGYILGKGGSVIKRMSGESGAQIQILPKKKLPCVVASDEIVQISGETNAVRKALQSVSEQLLGNPPFGLEFFPANYASSSSHSSSQLARVSVTCREPNLSFGSGWSSQVAGPWGSADFPSRMMPPKEMLTFRLLCPDEKVGGIIGKGGVIIKTIKHDTGCEIKILDGLFGSQDRVILVSGPAHPDYRISPAQDAVLRVQARIAVATSNTKDKTVPARLVVSSSQVAFLLGKGGSIISEMRKFSGAKISIGVDKILKDALEGHEIVQISGEHEAVQEALLLITARLLHYFFLDAFPLPPHPMDPVFLDPDHPLPRYMGGMDPMDPVFLDPGPNSNFGPPLHKFDHFSAPLNRDGVSQHDYHAPSLDNFGPDLPPEVYERKPRFSQGLLEDDGPLGLSEFASAAIGRNQTAIVTSITDEVIVPSSLVPVICGEDGACLKQIREFSDAEILVTDPRPGATETVIVISGTPDQFHAAQSLIQAFVLSETEAS